MAMRLFHTALASALFLFGPGSARPQAPDNPPAQQQKPSDPSAKPESTLPKTKKIWTNDDLSSRPIQVSGHGSAPTSSFSNGATFLTPADGQIVHPGQNVHFDLSIASGRSSGPVALLSPLGSSNEIRESAPYSFSFTTPRDESQVSGGSRLVGIHPVTAFGKVPGKEEYGLGGIQVDVEESELPTKLSVSGNMMSQYGPPGLRFFDAGSQQWLALIGTFPNGDILDVTNSTNLKLVSGNPKVVSVG